MQQRKTIPVSQIIQPTDHIFSSWIEQLHCFKWLFVSAIPILSISVCALGPDSNLA